MGKRRYWLRDSLAAGRTLEEFATGTVSSKPKNTKLKTSKKRKSKVVHRDQAGHTWSGMGPRPRWLNEALDTARHSKKWPPEASVAPVPPVERPVPPAHVPPPAPAAPPRATDDSQFWAEERAAAAQQSSYDGVLSALLPMAAVVILLVVILAWIG